MFNGMNPHSQGTQGLPSTTTGSQPQIMPDSHPSSMSAMTLPHHFQLPSGLRQGPSDNSPHETQQPNIQNNKLPTKK